MYFSMSKKTKILINIKKEYRNKPEKSDCSSYCIDHAAAAAAQGPHTHHCSLQSHSRRHQSFPHS
jgi:hypothetical protein